VTVGVVGGYAAIYSLFLVALLLDDACLGRVLEIATGRNEGAPRNEGSDLRP
jgi:hypothetical protein